MTEGLGLRRPHSIGHVAISNISENLIRVRLQTVQLSLLAIGSSALTYLTRKNMQHTHQGVERTGGSDIFDRGSIARRPSTGAMLAIVTRTFRDQGRFK